MLSFRHFLAERTVISSREMEHVHKVAAIIQAAIVHKVRTMPLERGQPSPSFFSIEHNELPNIGKYLPSVPKEFRIVVYASGPIKASTQTVEDYVALFFNGILGSKEPAMRDVAEWRKSAEWAVKDATNTIFHELTHVFQFLKNKQEFLNLPRVDPRSSVDGYINSAHEVEAFTSGFLGIFDTITRRHPEKLVGVHSVDDMIKVVLDNSSNDTIGSYYKRISSQNKRRFEIKFLKFLRDRRTRFAKFLDPHLFG